MVNSVDKTLISIHSVIYCDGVNWLCKKATSTKTNNLDGKKRCESE